MKFVVEFRDEEDLESVLRRLAEMIAEEIEEIEEKAEHRKKTYNIANFKSYDRPTYANSHYIKPTYSYRNLCFESYEEAYNVRKDLMELIEEHGEVTVYDLYDLSGVATTMSDFNYGWSDENDISSAEIEQSDRGWKINLPMPKRLK